MCQSITGPLATFKASDWNRMAKAFTNDDGSRPTGEQVRQWFVDQLAMGHEVIPLGDCDNFDYKKGCLGHPKPNTEEDAR